MLPRIRGLGGERLVVLLLVMVSVLAIQDVVISIFLIQEEAITAPTDALPTRLVVILTILEFTAFSTIFYRLPVWKSTAGEVPRRLRRRRSGAAAGTVAVAPEHVPHEIRGRRPGPVDDRVEIEKVSYGQRRDAVPARRRASWLGAPEIRLPRRSTMFRVNRGRFVSAYEGAASDSFDDLAHLGVAEAKQDESSALVPAVVRFVHGSHW